MRAIPAELAKRYEAEGWWTRDTFGDLLARRLAAAPQTPFRVHSAVRPWAGTFGDVEVVARRLAAGLRDRGVGILATDPAGPALIAFTSGTTRDPKGVIHSHQTLGFETRQLAERYPPDRGQQLTAAPVGRPSICGG